MGPLAAAVACAAAGDGDGDDPVLSTVPEERSRRFLLQHISAVISAVKTFGRIPPEDYHQPRAYLLLDSRGRRSGRRRLPRPTFRS